MSCSPNREHGLWLGLVAFVIGVTVLLQRFAVIPDSTFSYLWPSILAITGLKFMISQGGNDSGCCGSECDWDMAEMMPTEMPAKKKSKKTSKRK